MPVPVRTAWKRCSQDTLITGALHLVAWCSLTESPSSHINAPGSQVSPSDSLIGWGTVPPGQRPRLVRAFAFALIYVTIYGVAGVIGCAKPAGSFRRPSVGSSRSCVLPPACGCRMSAFHARRGHTAFCEPGQASRSRKRCPRPRAGPVPQNGGTRRRGTGAKRSSLPPFFRRSKRE